jgi:hypothetical protein
MKYGVLGAISASFSSTVAAVDAPFSPASKGLSSALIEASSALGEIECLSCTIASPKEVAVRKDVGRRFISARSRFLALGRRKKKGQSCSSKTTSREM